jgi:hypothetical protein
VLILILGLRKGDVFGLIEDDVDLEQGELAIGWQLQRVGGPAPSCWSTWTCIRE